MTVRWNLHSVRSQTGWNVCPSVFGLLLLAPISMCAAEDVDAAPALVGPRSAPSDGHALSHLFGDHFLAENVEDIRRRSQKLEPIERYRILREWVLPASSHDTFRLSGSFMPSHPVPPLIDDHPRDAIRLRAARERNERRVPTGGHLVSPVYDLLAAAEDLGQLPSLREDVAECRAQSEAQERCRLALLALIDIAQGESDRALVSFDELHRRLIEHAYPEMRHRWPETLLLAKMLDHPALSRAAEPLLQQILNRQVRAGKCNGPPEWDRQIAAFAGWLAYRQDVSPSRSNGQPLDAPPPLKNWNPVSSGNFRTHALGFPCAHWQWNGDFVQNLISHRDEYLYFRSPLTGEFQIECDTTGFGWKDCHPLVSGTWIAPFHTHQMYEKGTLRGLERRIELEPPLSRVNDWIRYRIVSQDGTCSTFLNGRLIHKEPWQNTSHPWFAIRSPYYGVGQVRDVRITGNPEIPTQISLSSDERLSGWVAYLRDRVGGAMSDWKYDATLGPQGGLFARRKTEFAKTFQESLLQYHRPMLEDGVIEYEFFYGDASHVHPAIGRKAIVLDPDGVRLHWVTNGLLDRSDLDPQNASHVANGRRPSLNEGWNRVRIRLSGDTITVFLNQQPAYEGELHATNDRKFGLFHYADQTEVRVRNIAWRGEWPKSLPPLEEQQLRGTHTDALDAARDRLAVRFEHDFERDGYPTDDFQVKSTDGTGTVEIQPNGLAMHRLGTQKFHDISAIPKLRIRGDFDIVATFDDLQIEASQDGGAAAYLIVVTRDQYFPHARVHHGIVQHKNSPRRRISQAEFNWYRPEGVQIEYEGTTAEACNAGRLRIARRGKQIDVLVAEADSSSYRPLCSREFNDKPLVAGGVRLVVGSYSSDGSPCSIGVLWKRLTIHADEIEGLTPTLRRRLEKQNTTRGHPLPKR